MGCTSVFMLCFPIHSKCKPTVTSPTGSYTPILHYDSRHLGFTEPEVPDLDVRVELIGGSNLSITR